MNEISCKQCGGAMVRTNKTDRKLGLEVVGVLLFVLGLILLFVFPIGTILGIILMILGARLGYNKKKVWLCQACGYFYERAK